jgi:hypothetical protein
MALLCPSITILNIWVADIIKTEKRVTETTSSIKLTPLTDFIFLKNKFILTSNYHQIKFYGRRALPAIKFYLIHYNFLKYYLSPEGENFF